MRARSPSRLARRPGLVVLILALGLSAAARDAWAQPTAATPRAGWRVGGATTAVARLGNVLFIGGNFRGIAPEENGSGGMLAVDPAVGLPVPGFPQFGGGVGPIEPDGAGGWYVGGNFIDVVDGSVQVRLRLAHVLANGDLDPAWTPQANGIVRALRLVPGVGLFVGGEFTFLSGEARGRVGLLDPATGAVLPWTYNVNGGTNPQVRTLAYDAGTLFIGGAFTTVDTTNARANLVAVSATASGQVGPDLGVDQPVDVLHVPAAGTLYVGGSFTTLKGTARGRVGRVTHAAGELDVKHDAWNPDANGTVRAIGVVDTSVFVGGEFFSIGGQPRAALARVDAASGMASAEDFDLDGSVNGIAIAGGTVYVVGPFTFIQNQLRGGAAAFSSAGALLPWNPSPAGGASAVAVSGSQVGLAGVISGYGALPVPLLAALDLQTGQVLPWTPFPNAGPIDEIVVHGGVVYVTGPFTSFDDEPDRARLAAIDAYTGLVLPWAPNPDGPITGMVADDTHLYVAGNFTTIAGQPRARLARFRLSDQELDPTFAPNVQPTGGISINDLVVAGTTLYVGGGPHSFDGGAATRLAAIDTTTGAQLMAFQVSPSGPVARMDVDGGFLYFTGNFTTVNGQPRQFVAKVDATTGALDPWSPPTFALDPTSTAAGFAVGVNDVKGQGSTVLITGAFATVGGQTRLGIVQVNASDGAVTSWAPNLGSAPGGFGGPILSAPDLTVIGGNRIQLPDELLNGLALFVEPAASLPVAPIGLTADVAGGTVTLRWSTAPLGFPPTSFILEAGSGPGRSDIAILPVADTTFTATGVPPGTYYLRVRAVTPLGTSAPTADLAITVGGAACTTPAPPPFVFAGADGSTVGVWWGIAAGTVPTSWVLEAGSGPGRSDLATLILTQLGPVEFNGVPPGVYHLRMRARNSCGTSAPSSEFVLNVGGVPQSPLPPFGLTGTALNGTVTLEWLAPSSSTVTGYILEAGTTQGAADIATIPVSGTTFGTAGVPPGMYYVRVRAVNAVGVSASSNELILVVP